MKEKTKILFSLFLKFIFIYFKILKMKIINILTWGPIIIPPKAKAANDKEKKTKTIWLQVLFFGFSLGLPLQQQQQQHVNISVNNLIKQRFTIMPKKNPKEL